MRKSLIFLGIESSCDETAASIVRENQDGSIDILSNIVSSQIKEHKPFGGVVPELAARSHVEKIDVIIEKAINESGIPIETITGVATTAGPGLLVCLMVGMSAGKTMATFLKKPFLAINHLEGHALSPRLIQKIKFPYLLLLISGGHSQFLEVQGVNKYKRLGTTIDDALGEAFDKTAKILGIDFPGGPKIEKFAKLGDKNGFVLPKPILHKSGCNLSFSGLKTAVLHASKAIKTKQGKYDLAASFQHTINEILKIKSKKAMQMFLQNNKKIKKPFFVIAGGVAANKSIRNNLENVCKENGFENLFPPSSLCSDNAAMIAWAGIERYKKKLIDNTKFSARPRWPLDEKAPFLKGAGVDHS
ncbi:tRNA (adenosine(37)-N6)-threonylcarbamoyltransferase complex transferase subunit TsaD [Pelagibacteraceae bacterium]|nr:tRNA (adenosine(37)-N6)-threonylcarbamoyltransferase complex transferase subunit TsaD [Pelagibacteraceae bacterium]